MAADEPGVLVGARKECPLIVGRGDGEQFLASGIPAFLAHTRTVQALEDDELVVLTADGAEFMTADGEPFERETHEIDWDADAAEKGGYETFMLKEIHEQADAVAETIADRTVRPDGVDLPELDDELLRGVKRIIIVACGTSYHAGLIGRYAIEEWARVPVEMDIASEYRYRNPVVGPGDLVIGITQSGETLDTLAAMRLARERGATVLAVTNIMGSQATRDARRRPSTRAPAWRSASPRPRRSSPRSRSCTCSRCAWPSCEGTLSAERRTELVTAPEAHPARHRRDARAGHRGDRPRRRAPLREGLLPLPRPPRRAAGRPRGRAEAQGDLLHRDRRVRGRRDEARPDRAARPGHARSSSSRPTRRCWTR